MKINKFILTRVLLTFGIAISVASCSDFLEEADPSNLNSDSFYKTPQHAEAAIFAVYAQTRFVANGAGIFSRNWQLLEAPTGTSMTETAQNSDLNNLYSLNYDGNTAHIVNWWNLLYRTIGQANLVIKNVPGIQMDKVAKSKVLGEAYFLRAWAYFYAVRLWGDIPLITEPQSAASEDFRPGRATQAAVYDLIVKDLTTAETSGLEWMNANGRVSQAAVKALLSKVYLTMAGFPLSKGASHFKLAADKSFELISYSQSNPSVVGLFPKYADMRDITQDNKLEHLFMIQFVADVSENPVQQTLLPYNKPINAGALGIGTTVPTKQFFNSYETGDLRTKNQEGYFYTSYFQGGTGAIFELGAPYIFKHFDVRMHGRPGVPGAGRSDLSMMNIRYADVLLTYAEAQNELGSPTMPAYDALKRIRDRAQLNTPALGTYNQATFREAVWRERWYELCYEGVTWFDMVRLRKVFNENTKGFDNFVGHINLSSNQPLQAKHLLFPLGTQEMSNNPNLKPQNPGY